MTPGDGCCGTPERGGGKFECPACGGRMALGTAMLMGQEVSAYVCSCGEAVYDLSGGGERCGSCPRGGCLLF